MEVDGRKHVHRLPSFRIPRAVPPPFGCLMSNIPPSPNTQFIFRLIGFRGHIRATVSRPINWIFIRALRKGVLGIKNPNGVEKDFRMRKLGRNRTFLAPVSFRLHTPASVSFRQPPRPYMRGDFVPNRMVSTLYDTHLLGIVPFAVCILPGGYSAYRVSSIYRRCIQSI